jgi:hypothetical protein
LQAARCSASPTWCISTFWNATDLMPVSAPRAANTGMQSPTHWSRLSIVRLVSALSAVRQDRPAANSAAESRK